MAHKVIGDKAVIDWTTGDPEGDRLVVLKAYKDFIQEVYNNIRCGRMDCGDNILATFEKWNIKLDEQVDEVPRIWIKRPEQ